MPRAALNTALVEVQAPVRLKKLAELAVEFDRIRPIHRAVEVGSVDAITSVAQLRPSIIDAIERERPPLTAPRSEQYDAGRIGSA